MNHICLRISVCCWQCMCVGWAEDTHKALKGMMVKSYLKISKLSPSNVDTHQSFSITRIMLHKPFTVSLLLLCGYTLSVLKSCSKKVSNLILGQCLIIFTLSMCLRGHPNMSIFSWVYKQYTLSDQHPSPPSPWSVQTNIFGLPKYGFTHNMYCATTHIYTSFKPIWYATNDSFG